MFPEIPNYPRCLNAMAEAEKAQAPEQLTAYIIELGILVTGYVTLASSAHRSLAFLRTMQPDSPRWKEIQP